MIKKFFIFIPGISDSQLSKIKIIPPVKIHQTNVMKHRKVLLRLLVIVTVLLFTLPPSECNAQRNASHKFEKELFGKTKKGKSFNEGVKPGGKAAKAIKKQEKKEAQRDKEDDKTLKELRKKHFERQSAATKERMLNNARNTEASYKAKKQKEKKEQQKPERHKIRKP